MHLRVSWSHAARGRARHAEIVSVVKKRFQFPEIATIFLKIRGVDVKTWGLLSRIRKIGLGKA